MQVERRSGGRPGSAWDVWHLAGWNYAEAHPGASDEQIGLAAVDYAMEKPFRMDVVKRAFLEGAAALLSMLGGGE